MGVLQDSWINCSVHVVKLTGNPYTENMNTQSNVIPLKNEARDLRRVRGAFVKSVIDDEERSARFVAVRIGLNPTSMSERLHGKSPFLADELENIARVLRIDPVEFYSRYISVGSSDSAPITSNPRPKD